RSWRPGSPCRRSRTSPGRPRRIRRGAMPPASFSLLSLLKPERRFPPRPVAGCVPHQFGQYDLVLGNARDSTMVLTGVVADLRLVDPVLDLQQRRVGARVANVAHHLDLLERKALEDLARPLHVGREPAARRLHQPLEGGGELLARERIDLVLRRVVEGREVLRLGHRRADRLRRVAHLLHPRDQLAMVVGAPPQRAEGDGHRRQPHDRLLAHLRPPAFPFALAASAAWRRCSAISSWSRYRYVLATACIASRPVFSFSSIRMFSSVTMRARFDRSLVNAPRS